MSHHIVILGAGISGLATGWFLKKFLGKQIRLTIIEKNQRVGGWIQTTQEEGFLFEQGPRSCRTKGLGQETLALIEELQLENEVLVPSSSASHRYIYQEIGLKRFPNHVWEVPFNSLTKNWLSACWRDLSMPKCEVEDESIQDFFSRRLGVSWVENLIDPFVSGIYAGDCRRLSLKSCFPLFHQWEQKQGSLLKGAWSHSPYRLEQSSFIKNLSQFPLFSFKKGMETLPRALAHHLKNELVLGQAVTQLRYAEKKMVVELENKECLEADQVISTLPTYALSSLLMAYPELSCELKRLSYASVAVVNIGFDHSVLPFSGFGYLIPSKIGSSILGCVWDSCIFPEQNLKCSQTRLTIIMGGSRYPEIEQWSEQNIVEQALQALQKHLGIQKTPQIVQVQKAQQAIPQYEVGYSILKRKIEEKLHSLFPHLILSGSAWRGVSINDCIGEAQKLVKLMVLSK